MKFIALQDKFHITGEIMEENEVLFKNTSKMNDEEISVFQNYALKKTILITSILFTLVFCGVGAGFCFIDLTYGIIFLVCGILGGFVLIPFLMKDSVKKQNKLLLGDKKYLNTFEFCEDYIFVTSQATSSKESNDYQEVASQKIFYRDIFKFVTYKEFMFIYINARQSFILNFRGMTKGTIAEVIELLKGKGIKFVDKSSENMPSMKVKK